MLPIDGVKNRAMAIYLYRYMDENFYANRMLNSIKHQKYKTDWKYMSINVVKLDSFD